MNTVNKNEDRVISFASDELRQYLLLGGLTPGQLPVIRLSVRDASAWDAFSCEAAEDAITICGTNPRSVLIGCYAYLKRLGFRFLAPGANHTVIPSLDGPSSLTVSRFEEKADCFHRGVCIEGSMSQENLLDYIEWMPKAGLNACFLQFFRPDVFFTRWYRHENNPLLPAEELTEDRLAAMDRCVTEACTRRGLMIHRVGHGWTSRALGYSGNGWQREPEPTDPVLRRRIAQLKGERKLFGGVPANTNLCYSCPDVRDALIREVCEYASAHPETDYLHFWLADTHNNVCECEDCRRTTLSDQYVEILNALDEALTERGLTTRIVFLLYQELLYPPKLTRFRHPERFTMMFAPISRTFESSYPEKVVDTRIVPWVRNHMRLPVGIDENLAFYRQWREVFKGDAFIYDYHLGRAHYGDLGYMTIARTLHRDLQRLQVLGFSGMVACQELRVLMPSALPIDLMGQTLWNRSTDFDTAAQEHFCALYGADAGWVRHYLEEISDLCDTDYTNANGPRLRPDLAPRYERIAALSRAAAEHKMMPSPAAERLQATIEQNILHAEALAALAAGDEARAAERFHAYCRLIRSSETRFQADLDVYRMIEVSEKFTGLREHASPQT